MVQSPRWIIASNRLPLQYDTKSHSLKVSSGGLVTAIMGIHSSAQKIWVGAVVDDEYEKWKEATPPSNARLSYDMVSIANDEYDRYYNGFSNDVLWPLLHYQSERVQFRHDDWESYQRVNKLFAEHINAIAQDGDLIWIHDFQLALVPKYLKELNPSLAIGWFLHVPFPSSEIFLELPVRNEILEGILASDLVGFQDYSYVRHFSSTVQRVFGIETSLFSINFDHHQISLGVFPVSIDFNHFSQEASTRKVAKLAKDYHTTDFVFLGVDRLDYTKGVDLKILSFYNLLKKHPELHSKVSLIQVAVPTRQDVDEYIKLKNEVEQLVGEVNGQFATPSWTPIRYLYHSVTFEQLMSLYRAADCLVVTSKRDGMNLVALEYVAAQAQDDPGVVLISEFTGAKSLLANAIPINPRDIEGTANKMLDVIQYSKDERQMSCQMMKDYLRNYTATHWGESFIAKLKKIIEHEASHKVISIARPNEFINSYLNTTRPDKILLLIDYDGTLVPICERPEDAVISPQMYQLLKQLSELDTIELVIISGRDQYFLMDQLKGLDVYIAAEHGALFFDKHSWTDLTLSGKSEWYDNTLQIMRDYSKQVPNSFIEQKTFCASWHYRKSPREFSEQQALKLQEELENGLSQYPARLIHGKKVIEVCAMEANKGVFVHWFLDQQKEVTKGFAIGDDRTDEDTFAELQDTDFASIKVGNGPTQAKYRVTAQSSIFSLLQCLFEKMSQPVTPRT